MRIVPGATIALEVRLIQQLCQPVGFLLLFQLLEDLLVRLSLAHVLLLLQLPPADRLLLLLVVLFSGNFRLILFLLVFVRLLLLLLLRSIVAGRRLGKILLGYGGY